MKLPFKTQAAPNIGIQLHCLTSFSIVQAYQGTKQTPCYQNSFLQENDCNSHSFLRDISYQINLQDLYKVVGTCFNNDEMDYCPIMVKINNEHLQKEYQGQYLLQVWDKNGFLVFEKPLQHEVKLWNISHEYLIYKPQQGDQNSNCYHITDLKNANATLLIKDPFQDSDSKRVLTSLIYIVIHLAYNDGIFYAANSNKVYLAKVKQHIQQILQGEEYRVELQSQDVQSILPGMPIHALFNYKFEISQGCWRSLVIIAFETEDNQLDFSQIIPQGLGTDEFTYMLKQTREIVPRDVQMDAIVKFSFIVNEDNMFYGITLRKSGNFDIYWNMALVDHPENVFANDVSTSLDTIYVQLQENNEVKQLSMRVGSSINYEQSEKVYDDFDFSIVFYQNIKNKVNLYNGFTLLRTTLFISHGQFVSLYNIQDNKWIRHCKFEEDYIVALVKKKSQNLQYKTSLDIAVVLANGSIYNNMKDIFLSTDTEEMEFEESNNQVQYIDSNYKTFELPGPVFNCSFDQQRNSWFSMLVKDSLDEVRMYTMHYDKLYEVKIGHMRELDDMCNLIHAQTPGSTPYIAIQKMQDITLYRMQLAKNTDSNEDITILRQVVNINVMVEDSIHTCMTLDINDHIILMDSSHFYKYDCRTKTTKTYQDQRSVGAYAVDTQFCYTISHSSGDKDSGLLLYDIQNILNKDSDVSYKLADIQVGFNNIIDWNQEYSRFSILKSLNTLVIIPALHRNTIAFIGMGSRDQYLATKMIKDKFIALDRKNYLFCWSVVTGKLLSAVKFEKQDYSGFQIFKSDGEPEEKCFYNKNWSNRILLVKYEAIKNYEGHTDQLFHNSDGIQPPLKNQEQFTSTLDLEYREYKLIEIISETDVKEHLCFIHPFYKQEKQYLYFDKNLQFMLEKLSIPCAFIYKREKNYVNTRFIQIKRFLKYPDELDSPNSYMRVLSPSYCYYIMIDKKHNQFVIKDTFTNREIFKIPHYLMNLTLEKPFEIMSRFKWVSDETIHVIDQQGIEVIVDLKGRITEIDYNAIPLFDPNESEKDPSWSYFTNRKTLYISQVKERLIRKYQIYKSAYYLEHKRDPYTMYDQIFSVDYQQDKCRGMFTADMPFTFLHWQMIEQLEKGELALENIENSQIELLCYNIIPGGNTVIHRLTENSDLIKKIFKIAHPNEEDVMQIAIHIPILQNLDHKSPMHLCLDKQDIRTLDTIFTYLSGYGLDHHSRAISDVMPFAIQKELPSILQYLDTRLQQTEAMKQITKGCLKDNIFEIGEFSLMFSSMEFQQKFIKFRRPGAPSLIERPIKAEFIDIPRIYHYADEQFNDFFGYLKRTQQIEIFSSKAIQKLVEFNYALVKEWTIRKLLIPFVANQIVLFTYLNLIFGKDYELTNLLDFPVQLVLGGFSFYFLYYNCYLQVKHDGWDFLYSIWNYINIITPCTILSVLLINSFNIPIGESNERVIQAIGVFFMWYKFLYFFRLSISYGYLTRLIILVIVDMSTFLVVLFFTIVAFSDTFLTISNGNDNVTLDERGVPNTVFVQNFFDAIIYVYLIVLGSFEMQDFEDSIATQILIIFFIVCTVFNTIVMLNLLIAIISETFSIVKANKEKAQFQEMAGLIADNSYLIPPEEKERYAQKNKYLMVVTDLDTEMDQNVEEVIEKLEFIKRNVLSKMDKLRSKMKLCIQDDRQLEKASERQDYEYKLIMDLINTIPGVEMTAEERLKQKEETAKILNQIQKNNERESNTPEYLGTQLDVTQSIIDAQSQFDHGGDSTKGMSMNLQDMQGFTLKKFNELTSMFKFKK